MNLLGLKRKCQIGFVKRIGKYNHECRMHGININTKVDVLCGYRDFIIVLINDRETVTIPKEIAKYIKVEKIK